MERGEPRAVVAEDGLARADCDDDKLVHWYDNEKDKTTGLCPNYTAAGWHSRKWGYGFSFAFDRAVALRHPFPPTYLGEDYDFVIDIFSRLA